MTPTSIPEMVFAGPLRTEYFLTPDGQENSHLLGGPVLYAGAGAKIWTSISPGLIARVGNNFPAEFLQTIQDKGLDIRGVHVLDQRESTAGFFCYDQWDQCIDWDPMKYYARRNLSCPPELLDYSPPSIGESQISAFPNIAIRREDIPEAYRQARSAYIAPCHYLSQITLSVALRQAGAGTICLAPSKGMYVPSSLSSVGQLLHGIDIFFASEENLRKLFPTDTRDIRRIADFIARMGPKLVLVQRELQGVSVYDSDSKRLDFFPFYPVDIKNPIGVGDAFCGGFLAAWHQSFNPSESALHGCISASLAMEGAGGLYALDRNPSLAEARLYSLRRSHPEE